MQENKQKNKYDLKERLANFAEKVIDLMKKIPHNVINNRMISQEISSAGSAGANYNEANDGESLKDFIHKIKITKKELRECKHWTRLLARANPEFRTEFIKVYQEGHELLLIFSKIITSCQNKILNDKKL